MSTPIGPASFDYYLDFSDMKQLRTQNDMFGWIMPDRRNPRYSYRIVDGMKFIKSYDTVVAAVPADVEAPMFISDVTRLWAGWSSTTMNHIAKFIGWRIPKDQWLTMPVGIKGYKITYWQGIPGVDAVR